MSAIALLLFAAAAAYGTATALRVPAVPLLIAAGLALSVTGAITDGELLQNVLLLGLTFLVFVAGTELNPKRPGKQGLLAAQVGLAQFFLVGGLGFGACLAMGLELLESAYIAVAMSASSTIVVIRLLQRSRQFFEPFGRMVLGVLLLQDLLVIFCLVALTRSTEGLGAIESGIFRTVLLLLLAWLCVRFVTPVIFVKLGLDEEGLLMSVLAILFLFLGLAWYLDLPVVAGAFLAGFSVSFFPVNGVVRGQLHSLSDFFSALFFTALGASLVLPDLQSILLGIFLALLVLVATPILVTWLAERAGMTARSALESGLLLAQTSELSLVVALLGMEAGHISAELMSMVALVTIITMTLTPFLASTSVVWRLVHLHPALRRGVEPATEFSDHVVLLGCGPNTMGLLDDLQESGHRVVVVDDDPAVIDELRRREIRAIRGDGADLRVLREAGFGRARAVISTLRRVRDNCRIARMCARVAFYVRVYEDEEAEEIEAAGGIPVFYSHAAADAFEAWFRTHLQG